jgi:hypothetical protein
MLRQGTRPATFMLIPAGIPMFREFPKGEMTGTTGGYFGTAIGRGYNSDLCGARSAIHPRIHDAILGNRWLSEKRWRESVELGLALNSRLVLAALVAVTLFGESFGQLLLLVWPRITCRRLARPQKAALSEND